MQTFRNSNFIFWSKITKTWSSTKPDIITKIFADSSNRVVRKSVFCSVFYKFAIRLNAGNTFVIMANPKVSVRVLKNRTHRSKIILWIYIAWKSCKLNAIKTCKTIIGSNVDVTLLVLHNSCNCHTRKTVCSCPVTANIIIQKTLVNFAISRRLRKDSCSKASKHSKNK